MNRPSLLKFTAIFLTAYLALLLLSMQYGQRYVELLLPLYRWEIGWCAPDYRVLSLGLQDNRGEAVVALNLKLVLVQQHAHPVRFAAQLAAFECILLKKHTGAI